MKKETLTAWGTGIGAVLFLATVMVVSKAVVTDSMNQRWERDLAEIRKVAPDSPIADAIERELGASLLSPVDARKIAPGLRDGDPVGLAALEKLALAKPAEGVPEVAAIIREVRTTGMLTEGQRIRLVEAVLNAPPSELDPASATAVAAALPATCPDDT